MVCYVYILCIFLHFHCSYQFLLHCVVDQVLSPTLPMHILQMSGFCQKLSVHTIVIVPLTMAAASFIEKRCPGWILYPKFTQFYYIMYIWSKTSLYKMIVIWDSCSSFALAKSINEIWGRYISTWIHACGMCGYSVKLTCKLLKQL